MIGVPTGVWSGYETGVGSTIAMRFFDTLLALPAIVLAIALVAFVGASLTTVVIAVSLTSMPQFGRMAYAVTLEQKEKDYVLASVALGARSSHTMFRSILPSVLPHIIIQFALSAAHAAMLEAALSFLGLGTQPPYPSIGQMLFSSQRFLYEAPWYGIFPGLALTLFVYGLNSLADILKQAIWRETLS